MSNAPTRGESTGVLGARAVAAAADAILGQCAGFVEALPPRAYAMDSRVLAGGTVGKHVRHVLDHFSAIFVGLDTGEAIMYDRRERNVPMETSSKAAAESVAELRTRLKDASVARLDAPVRVRIMLAGDGSEAELTSTVARELAFATHHAVHHHAMMKAIAQEHGCAADSDFGKAPSTINYARTTAP